jgi:hypothetical protein
LFILSQLLLVFVPVHADVVDVRCTVVIDNCNTAQAIPNDGIIVSKFRTQYTVSLQAFVENWTSFSSNVLHVRPLVRPDKVPDFFAYSLHYSFLRHSALLI